MKLKTLNRLIDRFFCKHPVHSEPIEITLHYRWRRFGAMFSVTRCSHVWRCTKCGQPFGSYVEAMHLER